MKKSTTILLLVAALSFGYLPTCTMNVEASNPTAVTDKDPKDHKTKKPKPHHKKPEPPHKVHHRKPEPPHKVHGHRPPRRPMPPVGTHYRERPQHCISISFNHAPYFFAEGIFYRYANANYVVVRPEIGKPACTGLRKKERHCMSATMSSTVPSSPEETCTSRL